MSRKPRKCRICRKRPVWRGGDVKDPGPYCKKCYHKGAWPERKTAKHASQKENEVYFPDPWVEPELYTQDFHGWSDFDVMLDVFFAGEVFEDTPKGDADSRLENVPPGWITGDNDARPGWVNEATANVSSPVFEPTCEESPPAWLSASDEDLPPSWPEEEATQSPFVWPMPLSFSAINVRRRQLANLLGYPVTPERLAHAWATGKLRR